VLWARGRGLREPAAPGAGERARQHRRAVPPVVAARGVRGLRARAAGVVAPRRRRAPGEGTRSRLDRAGALPAGDPPARP